MWGGSYNFGFSSSDPSAQCRARVWIIRSLLEVQDYRVFVFVQIRSADALLSPGPGGDQGTLLNAQRGTVTWYGAIRDCVLSIISFFGVCLCSIFLLKTSSHRGAVCDVTFRSEYLLFAHPPPRRAGGAVGGYCHDFPLC